MYRTYEELREKVHAEYSALYSIDKRFLNDSGLLRRKLFDHLDTAFVFGENKQDVAAAILVEIDGLKHQQWYQDAEECKDLATMLYNFLRFNFEPEFRKPAQGPQGPGKEDRP